MNKNFFINIKTSRFPKKIGIIENAYHQINYLFNLQFFFIYMESSHFDKKKSIKTFNFAVLLILVGLALALIIAVKFVGDDGYLREDAPEEWLYIALIFIILGIMILIIPILKIKKETEMNQINIIANENSNNQTDKDPEEYLKTLDKAQFTLIILTVIFFGILILLIVFGKLSLIDFIDAIF